MNRTIRVRRFTARKIAVLALFCAMGLLAFLIESLLPPMILPGAKPGISNIFSLMTLVVYGLPEALLVVAARTVLGSLFAGNFSLILYSLTAGLACTLVSRLLLFAFPHISLVCISVVSAVTHNAVQTLVYFFTTGTALIFSYLPYLALLGIAAGGFVGLAVVYLIKAIPASAYDAAERQTT